MISSEYHIFYDSTLGGTHVLRWLASGHADKFRTDNCVGCALDRIKSKQTLIMLYDRGTADKLCHERGVR